MRGLWDGNKKECGSIGCGIVIKEVDRRNRITVSTISVFVKKSTAMSAEVAGAYILPEILDMMFQQQFNVDTADPCIDRITRDERKTLMVAWRCLTYDVCMKDGDVAGVVVDHVRNKEACFPASAFSTNVFELHVLRFASSTHDGEGTLSDEWVTKKESFDRKIKPCSCMDHSRTQKKRKNGNKIEGVQEVSR